MTDVPAGGVVELVTPGSTARYVGNWTAGTRGDTARHRVTIRAQAGLSSAPILDGDGPDAPARETCSTASCDGPVLTVPATAHVRLTGITIADGLNNSGSNNTSSGLLADGSVTVTDCTFTGNQTSSFGAAIFNGPGRSCRS